MGFDFTFKKDKSSKLPATLQAALAKVVEDTAAAVEGRAKELAPIDTGNLVNSITHDADGLQGVVSAAANYAASVEFGTAKIAPQPFLTPAVEGERADFAKRVAKAVKDAAK